MSATISRARVKDYSSWRKEYSSYWESHKSNGGTIDHIYCDPNDSHRITVVQRWNSIDNARKQMSSGDYKAWLAKAGTIGDPTIEYFEETCE